MLDSARPIVPANIRPWYKALKTKVIGPWIGRYFWQAWCIAIKGRRLPALCFALTLAEGNPWFPGGRHFCRGKDLGLVASFSGLLGKGPDSVLLGLGTGHGGASPLAGLMKNTI